MNPHLISVAGRLLSKADVPTAEGTKRERLENALTLRGLTVEDVVRYIEQTLHEEIKEETRVKLLDMLIKLNGLHNEDKAPQTPMVNIVFQGENNVNIENILTPRSY